MKKLLSIFLLAFCASTTTYGQCADKQILIDSIKAVFNSKLPPKEQLPLLLPYLDTLKRCSYVVDSTHALLLRMIGSRYSRTGDFTSAIRYFKQSIDLVNTNSNHPAINSKHNVTAYFWLYSFYDSVGNINAKMQAVENCIKLADDYNIESSIECVRALLTKVMYLYDRGDYHHCIYNAKTCEKLAEEFAANNAGKASTGRQFASISLGWHIKALLELKQFDIAEQHLNNKADEYKKTGLKGYLGFIYSELAEVEISKANYTKALSLLQQALVSYREANDLFNVRQVMNTIGKTIYADHYHNYEKAQTYFKNALAIKNTDKELSKVDSAESLSIIDNLAGTFVQKGKFDTAFRLYRAAFNYLKAGINETNIVNVADDDLRQFKKIHYILRLMLDFGDAHLKKYTRDHEVADVQKALQIYKHADIFLNRINIQQYDLESKLFWRSENRRLYENALEACYRQGNASDAFYFFEKSRAVLLNNELVTRQKLGSDVIAKQVEVKRKILQLKKDLSNASPGSKEMNEIQQNLFSFQNELERHEQLIKLTNPLYYQAVLDTTSIRLSNAVANLLNAHDGLIEIFSGDSAVYLLILARDKSSFKRLDKMKYETAVDAYMSYLSNPDLLNRDFAGYVSNASNLYRLIFENVFLPKGRIIISTNGRYFPFEALVLDSTISSPEYFLRDHAVSYTYSARYLLNDFGSNTSAAKGSLLGVAPVQYTTTSKLASLSQSDESLASISKLLPSTHNLIGRNASTKNFLQQFPNYKILQLYTHASDTSNQKEPVIYFADGQLYLSDLIPEKPPVTRLVVLSACETGIGKLYQGEGIFSFNRGFAAFGVPSAISTLWAIDETATYRLTENFYKHLAKNLPIDVALQKAKLEFLQNASMKQKLPYYWAAIVLVGKTDSIYFNESTSWELFAAAAGAVGLLLFAGWKLRTRRKKISSGRERMISA